MQDEDRPTIDVQSTQLGQGPVTLGDLVRGIRGADGLWLEHHVQLEPGPASLPAGDLVAGAHREASEPGVPGIRIAQRAQVTPGEQQCVLQGVFGSIGVAQDELRDALEPRR